ncbi:DNA polymerase IV [Candidatus Daviesbacteria bacterium]|nr:DNA polymerase IV [Candidatus Daviesbacteria bacterium]
MKTILHIDFNSYFATVEQQANPRLRGKPIGVTGGDRDSRTVVGAASIEAKARGVKTGMSLPEALKLCPELILVRGDSEKYLECTKRFLNILKDYSPNLEVFSIDEVFLELPSDGSGSCRSGISGASSLVTTSLRSTPETSHSAPPLALLNIALEIKNKIRKEVGEWISCSIGISYNKVMAKFAGSLFKPNGLAIIADEEAAMKVLDQVDLDEICGIGFRVKKRLNNLGIFSFAQLRKVPLASLLAAFKSYGQFLYDISRGINYSPITPFYEKAEVKSIGHRHTLSHDTNDEIEIKQTLLKLTELVARRLRAKKLAGKTVSCWYRSAFDLNYFKLTGNKFKSDGMQVTISLIQDGLEIFNRAWKIFQTVWQKESIRMIGVSISNLKPENPKNLTFLEDKLRQEKIIQALDNINDRYGEFTLQRAILISSERIYRKPNPFLADRRFNI